LNHCRVENVEIIENNRVKGGYFHMSFKSEQMLTARPGQFMSLSVPDKMGKDMPLRRPFTVYRINSGITEVLYRVVGRGTELFSTLRRGDIISCLGPKGKTFPMPPKEEGERKKYLLLGRGIGMACLAWLGSVLKENGKTVATIAVYK